LGLWGVGLLALYGVLRGVNGLGNMGLLRHDGSLVQWLHVSKYPPSLTYWGLELGLGALLLALAFRARLRWPPLVLFGQTALFYYLLHAHLLEAAAVRGLPGDRDGGGGALPALPLVPGLQARPSDGLAAVHLSASTTGTRRGSRWRKTARSFRNCDWSQSTGCAAW
jgi:hypothetical protein